MKQLTLIRHAKSSWDNPECGDWDRPLNARGKRDAATMGQRLWKRHFAPEAMLSSPAKRAAATTRILAKEMQYPESKIRFYEGLYDATAAELFEIVHDQITALGHVALVGHNPSLTAFNNLLTEEPIDNIPTCGVVEIELPILDWAKTVQGTGRRIGFDYPKKRGSEPR